MTGNVGQQRHADDLLVKAVAVGHDFGAEALAVVAEDEDRPLVQRQYLEDFDQDEFQHMGGGGVVEPECFLRPAVADQCLQIGCTGDAPHAVSTMGIPEVEEAEARAGLGLPKRGDQRFKRPQVLEVGGADVVLLDNMSTPDLARAVEMVGGRLVTEASGNMRRDRVAEVCATGVDYVSSGALTHSARTLDLGLDF